MNFVSAPVQELVSIITQLQKPGLTVAEIGTYDGSTTRAYIDIIRQNNGHLYCIDTFQGNVFPQGFLEKNPSYLANPHIFGEHNNGLYDQFMRTFAGYKDMMTVHRGLSHDMIPLIPDRSLDIGFIDADHSYKGSKKDIDLTIEKIKDGGHLCGHDCETFKYVNTFSEEELSYDTVNRDGFMIHAGVIQAVFEKFGTTQLLNNVWVVQINR